MDSCDTCRFFLKLANECRKNPPSVFPVPQGPGRVGFLGVFAPTKAENWCGSYVAAPVATDIKLSDEIERAQS